MLGEFAMKNQVSVTETETTEVYIILSRK